MSRPTRNPRLARASALAVIALPLATGTVPADAAAPDSADRLGTTAIVLDPAAYDQLVEEGVQVTPIGNATVKPYQGTIRIRLPVAQVTGGTVKHRGGVTFSTADEDLTVGSVTIPASGFVSGTVDGSAVGDLGRAQLFFQAPSGSPFGDTSLRFTATFASYLNASFDTHFLELGYFGFATTSLR